MAESSGQIMDAIGGYFELELPHHEEYHKDAIRLNTGRNCLEYIFRIRKYKKVYIPIYTCEVILEPFHKLCVEYEFYKIDLNFELEKTFTLGKDEALLYTNYFGLKQNYIKSLAEQYGNHLIVDNTQAFYSMPIEGVDTFYTCRKFFGVPDGAYLYIDADPLTDIAKDVSYHRISSLTKRIDISAEAGYSDFTNQEEELIGQPVKRMSNLTQHLMQSIDYQAAASQRRQNYLQLQRELSSSNAINISCTSDSIPMVYPYLPKSPFIGLRKYLIENRIFVASYWPNVLIKSNEGSIEHKLASQMLPLPIDQRYGKEQMAYMLSLIRNYSINSL